MLMGFNNLSVNKTYKLFKHYFIKLSTFQAQEPIFRNVTE